MKSGVVLQRIELRLRRSRICASHSRSHSGSPNVFERFGQTSVASIVIVVLRNRKMGQPAFAPSAAFWNASELAFAILTIACRWLDVTVQAPLTLSKITVAVVSMRPEAHAHRAG